MSNSSHTLLRRNVDRATTLVFLKSFFSYCRFFLAILTNKNWAFQLSKVVSLAYLASWFTWVEFWDFPLAIISSSIWQFWQHWICWCWLLQIAEEEWLRPAGWLQKILLLWILRLWLYHQIGQSAMQKIGKSHITGLWQWSEWGFQPGVIRTDPWQGIGAPEALGKSESRSRQAGGFKCWQAVLRNTTS